MTSDLFKWNSMTTDLKADKRKSPQKKKQKYSEPKPKGDIECWLEKARPNYEDLDTGYVTRDEPVTLRYKEKTRDEPVTFYYKDSADSSPCKMDVSASVDVDQWLKKVTMAAEVASSDLVLDEYVDEDVNALFQSVLRDNLPYVNVEIDSPPLKESAVLEEKYDTLNEARSILSEWMRTKGDLETDSVFDDPCYRSNRPSYRSDQPSYRSDQSSYHDNLEEESVEQTLQKLRALPIEKKVVDKLKKKKKTSNPALSMALRQEKVKERRLAMEQERTNKLKSATERKQVRAQADEILKDERLRKEREAKLEEEKIQGEMVVLRKRLHSEQVERMVKYEREKEDQMCHHKEKLAEEYRKIVRETAEQEQSRKRLLTTRHQLLRQLEDAEKKELKIRYQTLQQTFTVWRESTLDQRVQSNRASVHYTWKLQLCAWCKWKKYHRSKVSEREEKVREVLFEENKRWRMAQLHYQHRNVFMCFKAWLAWTRVKTDKRREKLEELKRRLKMEECLATAVKITRNTKDEQKKDEYDSEKYDKRKRKKFAPNFSNPPPLNNQKSQSQTLSIENVQRLNEECVMRPNFRNTLDKKKPVCREENSQESDPKSLWSDDVKPSKSQRSTKREDINSLPVHYPEPLTSSNPWADTVPVPQPAVAQYPSLEPSTERSNPSQKRVPAALKGMEERAAQRKQRQMEIERRKEQKKEEEEERMRDEQRLKDEKERERKQLEKEKKLRVAEEAAALESQRVANLARHKEQMVLALQHYHTRLLTNYGLKPLKALLANIAADSQRAEQFSNEKCTLSYFTLWKERVRECEAEKERKADANYNRVVLKKSLRSWRRVMSVQETFYTLAVRHYRRVYRIRVMRAWSCAVKESVERREGLVIAADTLLYRATIKNHFSSWVRLVPILKREKERAGRKDALRSKVAMLLPDYIPASNDM